MNRGTALLCCSCCRLSPPLLKEGLWSVPTFPALLRSNSPIQSIRYGTDPDEHLVDFNGATSSQHQASGTSEPTASNGEFGIEDEDDPFADGL